MRQNVHLYLKQHMDYIGLNSSVVTVSASSATFSVGIDKKRRQLNRDNAKNSYGTTERERKQTKKERRRNECNVEVGLKQSFF
jgi:F0F1-type ATP synthase epsilon subunit